MPQNITVKRQWMIAKEISAEVSNELKDYPPILRQILFNRGIQDVETAQEYLYGKPGATDPFLLDDMELAVERIFTAIHDKEPIAIYGDYDVDGVTATALLVEFLRTRGADVCGYIPNRFEEGYGLNNEALDTLSQQGIKLVITVDCGIRSPREAEHARELGLDLIISDHHHPQDELPRAVAVICQKRPGNRYPDMNLSGVGLAYQIARAICLRETQPAQPAEDWLDLVALGTVADVVPLAGENRTLVKAGLRRIRKGLRQGLVSLMQVAGINPERVTASDIGFLLGPRLNAAGRIESALAAFQLLISTDLYEAGFLAQKLDDQNRERQKLTQQMQVQAEQMTSTEGKRDLIFAVHPDFNSGVVGLVASKLSESFYRPAVVGQQMEDVTRASCRSIPEFHITRALDECTDLLVRHGGHAAAAGFTVKNENLEMLEIRLKAIADRELGERELIPVLKVDMVLPLSELKPQILDILDLLQPTGQENPEVVFVSRNLRVVRTRTMGSENQHLRLTVTDGCITYDAVAFRFGHLSQSLPARIDLAYRFEKNVYNGRESLQLGVRDIQPSEAN